MYIYLSALSAIAGSVPQRGKKSASGAFLEPRGFAYGETSLHYALKMLNATAPKAAMIAAPTDSLYNTQPAKLAGDRMRGQR